MIYQIKNKSSRIIRVGNKYEFLSDMVFKNRLTFNLSASDKKELQTGWTVFATDELTQWQS